MDSILFICHSNFKKNNKLFLEKNNIITSEIAFSLKEELDIIINKLYDKYNSIFVILNESHFQEIIKYGIFFYTKIKDLNIKLIYLDDSAEQGHSQENIISFLDKSDRFFVISSRFKNLEHARLYNNLVYLPILFSFYHLNFSDFPKLDYPLPKNPKYDFITYLGQTYKIAKIEKRLEFLKYILDDDLSKVKYNEYDNYRISEKNMGPKSMGHSWNLINSLSAKIQLIFENEMHTYDADKNRYFLTEKIMKLFLLPHPYIVFLPDYIIESLKKYGFRFSYDGSDYKTLLSNIKKDIDGWIEKNQSDFYHNQTIFYNMVNSVELEHHLILEKIIKNEI